MAGALVVAWIGCARNNDLGLDTTSSGAGGATSGSSASSVSSSSASAGHGSSSGSSGSSGTTSSSGGTGGSEPKLPTILTVVNGINDYPAVRLCFLPDQTPWPAAATGLAFGASARVDLSTLPTGTALTTWVVAGDLTLTAGLTCAQVLALATPPVPDGGASSSSSSAASSSSSGGAGGGDAGAGGAGGGTSGDAGAGDAGGSDGGGSDGGVNDAGPPLLPLVARELASIPASVLTSERSLLFVPTGCLGRAGHDSGSATLGCGSGYTSTTPTAAAVLVGMSRIQDAKDLSLQVVSASPAIPAMDVHVLPAVSDAMEVSLAPGLGPGVIAPTPPFHALPVAGYGSLATVQVNTYSPGSTQKTSSTMLSAILATSAVKQAQIVDGANLVLVAVGGSPGTPAGPFWHPLSYALVSAY